MVELQQNIRCTVMHPRLFPALFLYPFHPQRINVVAEIDSEKLSFLSIPSRGKSRLLGRVLTDSVNDVVAMSLSENTQRLEIIRNSVSSHLLFAALISIYLFVFQSAPLITALSISMIAAVALLPLGFLLNGGFNVKDPVVRFLFSSDPLEKPFYLEVKQGCEAELQQALLASGLYFVDDGKEEVWQCDECGAVVDRSTTKCPNCGAGFEE